LGFYHGNNVGAGSPSHVNIYIMFEKSHLLRCSLFSFSLMNHLNAFKISLIYKGLHILQWKKRFFPCFPFKTKVEIFHPKKRKKRKRKRKHCWTDGLYTYAGVNKHPPMHHTLDAVMTQLWLSPNSHDVGFHLGKLSS
jgi:hypothetical protein